MKQIINGKLYDTDKAEKMCDVTNVFGHSPQTICKTTNGTLFVWNNNRECVDEHSEEWIKDYIGKNYPEKYIELFGEVEEA